MVEKQSKKQTMRFSDVEQRIIKNTFADRDDILIALRKHFIQKELTDNEKALLKASFTPEVLTVLRKTFLPEIIGDLPLNQEIDLLLTLQLTDKTPEDAYPHILAREMVMEYINDRLSDLEGNITIDKIRFKDLTKGAEAQAKYVNLVARNTIFTHVEQQLNQLNILAGMKEETDEEKAERIKKDSFK